MDNCVADSSFYICWADDLEKILCVHNFISSYQFHIGKTILGEIERSYASDKTFQDNINIIEYDYSILFEPIVKGTLDKGEYEAIGIANYLYNEGTLRLLVLDDGPAKKLLQREFPKLFKKQCGTVGFIRECYFDGNISQNKAIKTLDCMKTKIVNNTNKNKRICSISNNDHEQIIDPTIEEIRRGP